MALDVYNNRCFMFVWCEYRSLKRLQTIGFELSKNPHYFFIKLVEKHHLHPPPPPLPPQLQDRFVLLHIMKWCWSAGCSFCSVALGRVSLSKGGNALCQQYRQLNLFNHIEKLLDCNPLFRVWILFHYEHAFSLIRCNFAVLSTSQFVQHVVTMVALILDITFEIWQRSI